MTLPVVSIEVPAGVTVNLHPTAVPTGGSPATDINVALSSRGSVARASSSLTNYPPSTAINGDRKGSTSGGAAVGLWAHAQPLPQSAPQWLQVEFPAAKNVSRVIVFTTQDDYSHTIEPTDVMTFTQYGVVDFAAQWWDGAAWQAFGAPVVGNNLVKRTITAPQVSTTKIRVVVTRAVDGYARINELEAWGTNADVVTLPPPVGQTLSQASASMAAGTWVELTPSGLQETLGIGSQAADGSPSSVAGSGCKISFSNSCAWDPLAKKAVFVGADHGDQRGVHAEYSDAANAWSVVATGLYSHGFQHTAVNPFTGDRYIWRAGDLCKGGADGQFTKVNTFPFLDGQCVSAALAWWEGSFTGAGAQGALICYSGRGATVTAFDPLTGQHFAQLTGMSDANGFYHVVSAYSKVKNCMVYGGGNNASGSFTKQMWRLNSDQSKTRLTDAPFMVGINHGMNLTVDPVSGNFLFYGFGQFWELNPDGAGTWTQLTGTRQPPLLEPSDQAGGGGNSLVSFPCSTYGVTVYIDARYNRYPRCRMWAYKHVTVGPVS